MDDEKKLAAEYAEAGVELLPSESRAPEPEPKAEDKPEVIEPKEEPKPEDEKPEPTESLQTEPQAAPKRSIYQDLKETRREVKTERELRETAEKERDEMKAKLDAVATATTTTERTEAIDDLEAFAKEIDADPAYLKKMQQVFLKGLDIPKVDPAALERFTKWEAENSQAIEAQSFEKEFQGVVPSLKVAYPDATADELSLIRTKLDELAHTDQYHDKELDYVLFKNQDVIKTLVSPKKRGIESKGRIDATAPTFTFDPNADISKMSAQEYSAWEKAYKEATSQSELAIDTQGKKLLF